VILLIACGNSLRRDDGAGLVLAERLLRRCRRPDLEIHRCHQLTTDLAPRLAEPAVAAVLFVDAAVADGTGNPPLPLLRPLTDGPAAQPVGHHLTPQALLALSAGLYGRRPPAWQVLIPGEDFAFGEGLSAVARGSLVRAEGEVLAFLDGEGG
jgi:hydrogenase maturation protease